MRMSSCKRLHGKTIEGGASGLLGELQKLINDS